MGLALCYHDNWHALIFLFLPVGYILKLFCFVLLVGYCEGMFLCMYSFCLDRLS